MTRAVGVWIDHREAVVVTVAGATQPEETEVITSGMEPHVRYAGHARAKREGVTQGPEDRKEGQFDEHLDQYYDGVISHIRAAEAILIFGPGEAKGEFRKRLEHHGLGKRIVAVETADKMTGPQIAAKVRRELPK
jgi:hypothetical protein